MDFFDQYNDKLYELSQEYGLINLLSIDRHYKDGGYWNRFAKLKAVEQYIDGYNYHLLYEIQSLSNQVHFGILNCLLFRPLISVERIEPNVYNHRLTFMIESTIHGIYAYWNRIALLLNLYLNNPLAKEKVYMSKIFRLIKKEYIEVKNIDGYKWLDNLMADFEFFRRNEMTHNYYILMQEFLPHPHQTKVDYDLLIQKLVYHNNAISKDVYKLLDLLDYLEVDSNKKNKNNF
ncbi:hypothetical protein [Sphingobacterium sp.]|uniref:hypothetical protein n=1 Tax=Sphingobacterium sp. TaxID=341027 RepID=UPI00289F401B|nr:hypothetical protein [Sphingobacterium sp.]